MPVLCSVSPSSHPSFTPHIHLSSSFYLKVKAQPVQLLYCQFFEINLDDMFFTNHSWKSRADL